MCYKQCELFEKMGSVYSPYPMDEDFEDFVEELRLKAMDEAQEAAKE